MRLHVKVPDGELDAGTGVGGDGPATPFVVGVVGRVVRAGHPSTGPKQHAATA